jgi:hypothetical protein
LASFENCYRISFTESTKQDFILEVKASYKRSNKDNNNYQLYFLGVIRRKAGIGMKRRFEGLEIIIATIGVIVAIFAWLMPFTPTGQSPSNSSMLLVPSVTNTVVPNLSLATSTPSVLITEDYIRDVASPTMKPTITSIPSTSNPTAYKRINGDCGSSVDLGNRLSESDHDLFGWVGSWTNQPASPSGDTSFQYQPSGSRAAVKLCVSQIDIDYLLTTEVQDFGCDDSFEIYINNSTDPIYRYKGTRADLVRVHQVKISASEILSFEVIIQFRSITSDCGYAGVYNVDLSPY